MNLLDAKNRLFTLLSIVVVILQNVAKNCAKGTLVKSQLCQDTSECHPISTLYCLVTVSNGIGYKTMLFTSGIGLVSWYLQECGRSRRLTIESFSLERESIVENNNN